MPLFRPLPAGTPAISSVRGLEVGLVGKKSDTTTGTTTHGRTGLNVICSCCRHAIEEISSRSRYPETCHTA